MPPLRRILRALGAGFAFLLYVWVAAVRNLPRAKRRKASRRAARRLWLRAPRP